VTRDSARAGDEPPKDEDDAYSVRGKRDCETDSERDQAEETPPPLGQEPWREEAKRIAEDIRERELYRMAIRREIAADENARRAEPSVVTLTPEQAQALLQGDAQRRFGEPAHPQFVLGVYYSGQAEQALARGEQDLGVWYYQQASAAFLRYRSINSAALVVQLSMLA